MDYEPLTKARLLELIKDEPDHAVINIDYKGLGGTSNIDVFPETFGANNHNSIIHLDAHRPSYLDENDQKIKR